MCRELSKLSKVIFDGLRWIVKDINIDFSKCFAFSNLKSYCIYFLILMLVSIEKRYSFPTTCRFNLINIPGSHLSRLPRTHTRGTCLCNQPHFVGALITLLSRRVIVIYLALNFCIFWVPYCPGMESFLNISINQSVDLYCSIPQLLSWRRTML